MTTATKSPYCLPHALKYASIGWHVFPLFSMRDGKCRCGQDCPTPGKHPITSDGFKSATIDKEIIHNWWRLWPDANVGIKTGFDSGIVVLDIDPRHDGTASLGKLMDQHGDIPMGVEAITGSGGRHIFFKMPRIEVRNSSARVGPGIDVRGEGGYVCAAPSNHASGGTYYWEPLSDPTHQLLEVPEWLLRLMLSPMVSGPAHQNSLRPDGRKSLGEALARCQDGNRNETGFWLACQIRDNNLGMAEGESLMREYVARCPQSGSKYTEREALQSLQVAFKRPARRPAESATRRFEQRARSVVPPEPGASSILAERLRGVVDGKIYNVPMPWPLLTGLTQMLLPGSIACICGEPGAAKTFLVLQCLRFWQDHGHASAAFFIESDRTYHLHRLLAQLETSFLLIDYEWIKNHGTEVSAAMDRHREALDRLGNLIHSAPESLLGLDNLLAWVCEQCNEGKRVLVVDPITAVNPGPRPWDSEREFVFKAKKALNKFGASMILITHPGKGRSVTKSRHDQASSTAYHRFTDTNLWLRCEKEAEDVKLETLHGPCEMRLRRFIKLNKTRDGKGAGQEIGYRFGDGLEFSEQGIIAGASE